MTNPSNLSYLTIFNLAHELDIRNLPADRALFVDHDTLQCMKDIQGFDIIHVDSFPDGEVCRWTAGTWAGEAWSDEWGVLTGFRCRNMESNPESLTQQPNQETAH
jgi:hypothetical protein